MPDRTAAALRPLVDLIRQSPDSRGAPDRVLALLTLVRVADDIAPFADQLAAVRGAYGTAPARIVERMLRQVVGRPYYARDPGIVRRFLDDADPAPEALRAVIETLSETLRPLVGLVSDTRIDPRWRARAVETIRRLDPAAMAPPDFGRLLSAVAGLSEGRVFNACETDPRLPPLVAALAARGAPAEAVVFDPQCGTGDLVAAVAEQLGAGRVRAIGVEPDRRLSTIATGRLALESIDATLSAPEASPPQIRADIVVNIPSPWRPISGARPAPGELLAAVERGDIRWLSGVSRPHAAIAAMKRHGDARGALAVPPLGRQGASLRRWLVDQAWLEAVIELPAIWSNTAIRPTLLLIDTRRRYDRITLIDGGGLAEADDWPAWVTERLDGRVTDRVRTIPSRDFEPGRPFASYFHAPSAVPDPAETGARARHLARSISERIADPRLIPEPAGRPRAPMRDPVPLSDLAAVIGAPRLRGAPDSADPHASAAQRTVTIVRANTESQRQVDAAIAADHRLHEGDILVSQPSRPDRPPPTRVWTGDGPAIASNHTHVIRSAAHGPWLALYLSSPHAGAQLIARYRGAARTPLSLGALRGLPIPMPPAKIRAVLVEQIGPALAAVEAARSDLGRLRDTLEQHTDALLGAAFPPPDDPEP